MADCADSMCRACAFAMETDLDGTQKGKCSAAASRIQTEEIFHPSPAIVPQSWSARRGGDVQPGSASWRMR